MVVAIVVALVLTCGILAAGFAIQGYVIRGLEETVRVQLATERRLAANVRLLQEDLVHHAVEAQVVTWWRNRNVGVS